MSNYHPYASFAVGTTRFKEKKDVLRHRYQGSDSAPKKTSSSAGSGEDGARQEQGRSVNSGSLEQKGLVFGKLSFRIWT